MLHLNNVFQSMMPWRSWWRLVILSMDFYTPDLSSSLFTMLIYTGHHWRHWWLNDIIRTLWASDNILQYIKKCARSDTLLYLSIFTKRENESKAVDEITIHIRIRHHFCLILSFELCCILLFVSTESILHGETNTVMRAVGLPHVNKKASSDTR